MSRKCTSYCDVCKLSQDDTDFKKQCNMVINYGVTKGFWNSLKFQLSSFTCFNLEWGTLDICDACWENFAKIAKNRIENDEKHQDNPT